LDGFELSFSSDCLSLFSALDSARSRGCHKGISGHSGDIFELLLNEVFFEHAATNVLQNDIQFISAGVELQYVTVVVLDVDAIIHQ
jgi:hypothetical protein